MTFNSKWRQQSFCVCPEAEDLEAARHILADQLTAVILERGRIPQQPEKEQFDAVAGWLAGGAARRPWLVLYGTPGTGKTTYMTAVERSSRWAYRAADPIPATIAEKASGLGIILKTDQARWEQIKKCKMLLLDDVGFDGECEVVNNYGVNARPVNELLEYRYDRRLHTVMTTNLTREALRDNYGGRIWSRMQEMAVFVRMTGQDWREI